MVKFDETDIKILRELNKNVRVTVTEIAEKTCISRPTISNRIKKLFDNELILSHCGLNMGKLGYKMAAVSLEVKNDVNRHELMKVLVKCPRVLTIFRTSQKSNVHVGVWGEDLDTVNSMVDSLRDFDGVNIVETTYLGSPVVGRVTINSSVQESEVTPCERVCLSCYRYQNELCTGCPASTEYRDPLR